MTDDEFVGEQIRALTARVIAQGAVIEMLLGALLADRPPEARAVIIDVLRRLHRNPTESRVETDQAAVFVSDVIVQSGEAMEHLLARAARYADAGEEPH